jgi:predicted dehydrogenase
VAIGVGLIGISARRGWGALAHLPALRGLSDYEVVAVANRRQETADEAAAHFDVPLAFGDPRQLVEHGAVDLVVIATRVMEHDQLVRLALEGRKHVYCEWPLGVDVAEAEGLAALARHVGVRTATGLQGYHSAGARAVRQLIADGAIGRPTAMSIFGAGGLYGPVTPQAYRYTLDEISGATLLTVPAAHWLATIERMMGRLKRVSATALTVLNETVIAETGERVPLKVADQIAIGGEFESGALLGLTVHSGVAPSARGFHAWITGTKGTLLIEPAGDGSFQIADWKLTLHRSSGGVEVMSLIDDLPSTIPAGPARNVARTYRELAPAILDGTRAVDDLATFDAAVRFHRLIAAIDEAAKAGRTGAV